MNLSKSEFKGLIIWTLRRTGGTNFTGKISNLLKDRFRIVQHEPFNLNRIFGFITQEFKEGNVDKTRDLLVQELSIPTLIKHCVETVPRDFNFLLADIIFEMCYFNLFLYRQNSADRLLSLHFANKSNIWGPNMKKSEDIIDKVTKEPIPIKSLFNQDLYDRKLLRDIYIYLKNKNAPTFEITYEELYYEDESKLKEKIEILLKMLQIDLDANKFIDELRKTGYQGTRECYKKFPNIKEYYETFKKLNLFCLDPFGVDFNYLSSLGEIPFPEGEIQRLNYRKWILNYAKKRGIGAEIGVFRGRFAEVLLKELKPKKLYLIDPWTKIGEKWGLGENSPYTAYGKVTTKYAREDTKRRILPYIDECEIIIVEDFVENFIFPEKLDWIYLDTSHTYDDTLRQINYLIQFLKPEWVLMGDDWNPDPFHKHHGVFKAVNEFIKNNPGWEIVACGYAAQWCIRRKTNVVIQYQLNKIGEVEFGKFIDDWHIDYIPRVVNDDTSISLNGVIVINEKYNQNDFELILVKNNEEIISIAWFINSPWYTQKHPQNPNAKKARFSSGNFNLKNGDVLTFLISNKVLQEKIEILRITRKD